MSDSAFLDTALRKISGLIRMNQEIGDLLESIQQTIKNEIDGSDAEILSAILLDVEKRTAKLMALDSLTP
jgi:hypothetical protein